jgi:hypothetical protein
MIFVRMPSPGKCRVTLFRGLFVALLLIVDSADGRQLELPGVLPQMEMLPDP